MPHAITRVRTFPALLLLLALMSGLAGCVERPPKATTTPEDPAGRAQCFANQQTIEQTVQTKLLSGQGTMPRNYGQVKSLGFLDELLWCPAGGNMIWVPLEGGYMNCDVHGQWQDAPR